MNDDQAVKFARLAMRNWGVFDCKPRLIKNRENAVFEVNTKNGDRAALRLHRPGYQNVKTIQSELIWSEGLVTSGMTVPRPIRTLNGELVARVDEAGRDVSVVSWIDGVPLGQDNQAFEWDEMRQAELYFSLGRELSRLHRISDDLSLGDHFERANLGIEELLGSRPNWGKFWLNPCLTNTESALLVETRDKIKMDLKALPKQALDFGLIHADALRENVLVQDRAICLIDFDDGVFGYRLYDLGVAMSQNWRLPNAPKLANALCLGYGLQADLAELVPVFTVIRALASCGWAISRYSPDDPILADYANRAVEISQRYRQNRQIYG